MPVPPELAHDTPPGNGPPALLVHGFLAGRSYWQPNVATLAEACRPVVVELWGHGRSPSPTDPGAYRLAGLVDAFERLRVALGHESWAVVGHSLGAAIATQYALAVPERVTSLVITNSQSAFPGGGRERMVAGAAKLAAQLEGQGMAALDDHPLNPKHSRRLDPAIRAGLQADFAHHDPVGLAGVLRWTLPEVSPGERLADLVPPTLLTWGVRESAFDRGAAEARDRIDGLQVVELEAGHPVNLHDADGFNRAVTRFLARTGG